MKDKQFQRVGTQNVQFVEFAFCTRYWVGNFFSPKTELTGINSDSRAFIERLLFFVGWIDNSGSVAWVKILHSMFLPDGKG